MAIFMNYEGVTGPVTAEGYTKQIELHSIQWGVGRGISAGVGGKDKREASAPSISEITITKTMDASSPLLLKESLGGKAVKVDIHITQTNAAGKHIAFQKFTLENTLISGYSLSSGGDRPSESLSINFSKVTSEYMTIDDKFAATSAGKVIYDLTKAVVL